jgi:hypothetical protein
MVPLPSTSPAAAEWEKSGVRGRFALASTSLPPG